MNILIFFVETYFKEKENMKPCSFVFIGWVLISLWIIHICEKSNSSEKYGLITGVITNPQDLDPNSTYIMYTSPISNTKKPAINGGQQCPEFATIAFQKV